jgi:tryptophan-rich sensory protein
VLAGNAASLGAYAWLARGLDPKAAVAVAPNLAWLGFASVLNSAVISKNSVGPTRLLAAG